MSTLNVKTSGYENFAKEFPKATARALNKTAIESKKYIAKKAAQRYNITQAMATRHVFIAKRATDRDHQAIIRISLKGSLSLTKFNAVQALAGTRVEIIRGAPKLIKHAFIATMPGSGHVGVFLRKTRARLPIEEAKARPGLLVSSSYVIEPAAEFARELLPTLMEFEAGLLLKKAA